MGTDRMTGPDVDNEIEEMRKETGNMRNQVLLNILEGELIPAMGCTEPIALALAAAKAKETLGCMPDEVLVQASGSIIKNVKSVIIPNTGNLKGIAAAAAAGIAAGDAGRGLEVIAGVKEEDIPAIRSFIENVPIKTEHLEGGCDFDLIIAVRKGDESAKVRILGYHTNIVYIEKNGRAIYGSENANNIEDDERDYSLLTMKNIWEFVRSVDVSAIAPCLKKQILYNTAIAEEGLRGDYGANIGKVLLATYGDHVANRAKAKAAAGSDARMNGCNLPVVINSGSGNQGITCCVPVVEYAAEWNCSEEKLLRALALSNLTAIYTKKGIGTLSAYCGAVSAGAGAGAGIAYLKRESYEDVIHTVVNALAVVSGIVCDGAKSSCAAKIAASLDAAILGFEMYQHGQEFKGGDGIIVKGIDPTIRNIGRLGKDGMRETNREIIRMMLEE